MLTDCCSLIFFVISEKWDSIFKLHDKYILSFQPKCYKTFSPLDISLMRENKTTYLLKKKKQTLNVVLHRIAPVEHSSQAKLAYLHSDRKH